MAIRRRTKRTALNVLTMGLAAALPALAGPAPAAPPRSDPPAAAVHVARARVIAGERFAGSLFLCDPESGTRISKLMIQGAAQWLPPTRAFDNLFYVGNAFVGVWVLRTSKGLILFDAAQSEAEARDHLVPGLLALGLDPATIRTVVVTHGHWDHFGGAKYLQDTFGARIAMSGADWAMLAASPPGSLERAPFIGPDRADRVPPRRDLTIADGQRLVLGDTAVRLYVTPGHTPGTLSAVIPAREHGRTWPLVLLGGTAFPPTLEGNAHTGGLRAFDGSVRRLAGIARTAGAVGTLNTHIFADGSDERLAAAGRRRPGQANPFVIGRQATADYYRMFDECLLAAAARPMERNAWSDTFEKAAPPPPHP